MITAETAKTNTKQALEDSLEKGILGACEGGLSELEVLERDLPQWLQEKVKDKGFSLSYDKKYHMYKIFWGSND